MKNHVCKGNLKSTKNVTCKRKSIAAKQDCEPHSPVSVINLFSLPDKVSSRFFPVFSGFFRFFPVLSLLSIRTSRLGYEYAVRCFHRQLFSFHDDAFLLKINGKEPDIVGLVAKNHQCLAIRQDIQILGVSAADRQDADLFQKACFLIPLKDAYRVFPGAGDIQIVGMGR